MNRTLAILAALALIGCPSPGPVPPPGPETDAAGPNPTCVAYCAHVTELGCPQAKPTPKGATCTEVCENVQGSGYASLDLRCGFQAKSCAGVTACER